MSIQYVRRFITKNQAYLKNESTTDERYLNMHLNGPSGAVLHSIGTPQPSGEVIAEYFDSPTVEASVHMVLEPNGTCYRLAPNYYRMWHAGGTANNTHMGIEMTEPRAISYDPSKGYAVTILDRESALSHVKQTYERAVELFADLCLTYGWDPLEDGVILSHRECYNRGLGSNHGDPEHLWEALHTGYTMDTFRKAVWETLQKMKQETQSRPTEDDEEEEEYEMRYQTLGELREDPKAPYYLPTIEKLIEMGVLLGKGGRGDDRIIDLSEDAVRILVLLDRVGLFS